MIRFLSKKTILAVHKNQIEEYGGSKGIRDEGLLESALAQPEASFGGDYVHQSLFEMAAAYGYHICKNHPFYDGNKRTAFLAMYMFLYVNGWELKADKKVLYATMIELARGKFTKKRLSRFLREKSQKRGE